MERSEQGRITLVRAADRRRVYLPPNQVLSPRSVHLLLLSAEVDEATFDVPASSRH
jgi:hypothetical protein